MDQRLLLGACRVKTPLPGLEHVRLTDRQAVALYVIREHGPIGCADLGRRVREIRSPNYPSDLAGEWDVSNGKTLGRRLKELGLVRELAGVRFVDAGWTEPLAEGAYDPQTAEVPF